MRAAVKTSEFVQTVLILVINRSRQYFILHYVQRVQVVPSVHKYVHM